MKSSHSEHDFQRTTCACEACTRCCKRQPGPLAPDDFDRIVGHFKAQGMSHEVAVQHVKAQLCASPGALVMNGQGETKRVGSITPRFRRGRCVFLDEHDRCSIHAVAPFGCAYFDTHMGMHTAHPRSVWLANATAESADYQRLRDELPYATHHKPTRYR